MRRGEVMNRPGDADADAGSDGDLGAPRPIIDSTESRRGRNSRTQTWIDERPVSNRILFLPQLG